MHGVHRRRAWVTAAGLALLWVASLFLVGLLAKPGAGRTPSRAPPAATALIHLNRYEHFTRLMRDPRVECEVRRYESAHDGSAQSVMVLRPAGKAPGRLFFCFHGMDGDCGDAVVMRELVVGLGAAVVAPGGRGPCWLSDAFLADAGELIRRESAGFDGYYLIGIS
ncbi:MAG TPA: hypothetical protein VFW33_07615, partial [Gemmataceae bacterium]|nr:hypothetical protein [Gemmataceae bacterium]